MDIEDLRRIVHLSQTQNLQTTAISFNITKGAVSKTLKKIESQINTKIFDRVGRHIHLNINGKKFIQHARELVFQYDQMISEFVSTDAKHWLNIAGPSVLLNSFLGKLLPHINAKPFEVNIETVFEGEAINLLKNGIANLAIVTDAAISDWQSMGFEAIPLGATTFKLVAAKSHPINSIKKPTLADINNEKFACPSSSPFCGLTRGIGSDSWPDHKHPRNITFRCNSFTSLIAVIKKENLLAYIPDIAIDEELSVIDLADFSEKNQENISLVFKPSFAAGWLNQLVEKLVK